MSRTCAHCGTGEGKLLKCGGCGASYYCSKEHQRQGWKSHKVACKQAQQARRQKVVQPANKVLVVGSHKVGKKFILHHIAGKEPTEHESSCRWQLDTKYYSAAVDLRVVNVHEHKVELGDPEGADVQALFKGVQGLLLLFDASSAESLAVVQAWGRACTHFNPELMLCISVETRGAGTADAALEERARDFALDHGLEFIPVPYTVTNRSAQQQLVSNDRPAGSLLRGVTSSSDGAGDNETKNGPDVQVPGHSQGGGYVEKYGLDRVVEALQCTMWAHMSMKRRGAGGATSASAEPATVSAQEAGRHREQAEATAPKKRVAKETATNNGQEEERIRAALHALKKDAPGADPEFDAMSSLFEKIRGIRESSRAGNLSDEDRRARAEAAMLQVMALMPDEESDEGEGDSN